MPSTEKRPVAVITGASQGIGLALAVEFARRGHHLLLIARDEERLAAAATHVRTQHAVVVHNLALDLTRQDATQEILQALERLGLSAEFLVNNAAMACRGSYLTTPVAEVLSLVDLNIRTTSELIGHLLPPMIASGRGGVLNVASLAGMVATPNLAAYGASKAYLISLTRALAIETKGHGVRIAVLAPGPVETAFLTRSDLARRSILELVRCMRAEVVARVAYEGFVSGRVVIVPGLLNLVYSVGLKLLPPALLTVLVRRAL